MRKAIASQSDPSLLVLAAPLPLTLHPAEVYLSSLGRGSRRTMRTALNAIASLLTDGQGDAMTLNWAALRYQHTAAVRSALMENYAPATANKMLCALRRVLEEALRLELIGADDYARAVDIKQIKSTSLLRGRALSGGEIAALIQVCASDPTPAGVRDAALISILRGSGVRRSEVVSMEVCDYDRTTGALRVRGGKGRKDRIVYLPGGAKVAVDDWLVVRGETPGALLCPVHRYGYVHYRHMSDQAVLVALMKRAKQAGVKGFSAHDFRRTFISDLLDANVDVVTVQKLAGHASPETVSIYDRRGEESKRKAVEWLHVPYVSRHPQGE